MSSGGAIAPKAGHKAVVTFTCSEGRAQPLPPAEKNTTQVLQLLFIDIQVGTIATGLEMLQKRRWRVECVCLQSQLSGVHKEERGGQSCWGSKSGPGSRVIYTGTWAPRPKPRLLLSPDSQAMAGQLSTGAKQRCCCPFVIKAEGFQFCIPPSPLAWVGP